MFHFYYAGTLQSKHRTIKAAVLKAYSYPSRKDIEITSTDGNFILTDEFSSIDCMGIEWFKAYQDRREAIRKSQYSIN